MLIVQRSGVPLMIDPDRGRAVAALLAAEPLDLVVVPLGATGRGVRLWHGRGFRAWPYPRP